MSPCGVWVCLGVKGLSGDGSSGHSIVQSCPHALQASKSWVMRRMAVTAFGMPLPSLQAGQVRLISAIVVKLEL